MEDFAAYCSAEGEFPVFSQRILVSTAWGRVHTEVQGESVPVAAGARVGRIGDGPDAVALLAPVVGLLLAWLATDGESVAPGTPIASFDATA